MDWSDKNVISALDDYRNKLIGSLDDLRTALKGISGIVVSRMTLSRRIRGISVHDSGGRPKKRDAIERRREMIMQVSQ
jgi:hypothetical protein